MGAVTRVGIEKIHAYPGTLSLSLADLCRAREHDPADIRDVFLVDERSVVPPWEDPVTLAVNAARPLLAEEDRGRIGLLLVASESGVDQEKPMSTWVHRFLALPPTVRNLEVKHACYGSTGALQLAVAWIASGQAEGRKALVVNTDISRAHLGRPWEFVLGAAAVAVLVSDRPRVLEVELGQSGVYTHEVSDLTRPTARVETGNSETSLLSYLEALQGAYDDYVRQAPGAADLDRHFARHVYHLPFGGMGFRAHKTLLARRGPVSKAEAWAHFERKSLASLRFVRRMGGTYGASPFLGLMGLVEGDERLRAGDRVGVFSYGSGSCGEMWSGFVGEEARAAVAEARLGEQLDARRRVSVSEYEAVELSRAAAVDEGHYRTDRGAPAGLFESHYAGRGLLVFDGMAEFYRRYSWS